MSGQVSQGQAAVDPWGIFSGGKTASNRSGFAKYLDPLGLFNTKDTNKRGAPELAQFAYGKKLGVEATQFGSAASARLSDLADLTDEKYFAGGKANADAQQAAAGQPKEYTSTGILGAGIKRGGALARIGMMTGKDVDMQGLRDRVSLARFGQGIRSGQSMDLQNLQSAQDVQRSMTDQASAIRSAGTANFIGTAAGSLGRWGQEYSTNRQNNFMTTMASTGYDRVGPAAPVGI